MSVRFSFICAAILFFGLDSVTSSAQAATLNLNVGDSAVIQPNVMTTVTCGGSGTPVTNCVAAIKSFDNRYATCKKTYPPSTCYQNEWPAFKTRNPDCVEEAFDACYRVCAESYPGSTCYQNCR